MRPTVELPSVSHSVRSRLKDLAAAGPEKAHLHPALHALEARQVVADFKLCCTLPVLRTSPSMRLRVFWSLVVSVAALVNWIAKAQM